VKQAIDITGFARTSHFYRFERLLLCALDLKNQEIAELVSEAILSEEPADVAEDKLINTLVSSFRARKVPFLASTPLKDPAQEAVARELTRLLEDRVSLVRDFLREQIRFLENQPSSEPLSSGSGTERAA
jgi:hypothetical protein